MKTVDVTKTCTIEEQFREMLIIDSVDMHCHIALSYDSEEEDTSICELCGCKYDGKTLYCKLCMQDIADNCQK